MSYFQLLAKSIGNMFGDPALMTGIPSGISLSILWLFLLGLGIVLGEKGNKDFPWLTVSIILTTAAFLLIGMLASWQSGLVHTGMLAGLVAGLTGWTILWVYGKRVSPGNEYRKVEDLFWYLLILGIGAGAGALGGLIVIGAKW